MESASCSRKTSRIMLVFHAPLFALMSALTLVSTGRILCGEDIRNVVGLFVHLSFQMLICFPLPTCHLTPSLIRDWADQILLQAKDGWWPFLACIKSSSGKYLFLKTLQKSELPPCYNRQPCLAKRATLKALKSLKPMPPSIFGSYSLSHFIHAIFCSLPFCPYQKFRTMLVMSSHRFFGNRKQLMVCVGTACAIAFISISFLHWIKAFPSNPLICQPIFLSTVGMCSALISPPMMATQDISRVA